jgi:hypothetical protein
VPYLSFKYRSSSVGASGVVALLTFVRALNARPDHLVGVDVFAADLARLKRLDLQLQACALPNESEIRLARVAAELFDVALHQIFEPATGNRPQVDIPRQQPGAVRDCVEGV